MTLGSPIHPSPERRRPLWWRFACALTDRHFARTLASLALDGYLAQTGWTRSVRERAVVDAAGAPVPWATLSFLEFLGPRLRPSLLVFEYGSGASTRYYASRVRRVIAVEHDGGFAAHLRGLLPANAEVWERGRGKAYTEAVFEAGEKPDLISVDGRDRVACVCACLPALAPGGVLVLDDTDRAEYAPATARLQEEGFKRLDFWGFAPGLPERRCTSVFYRSDNVLGL